MYTIWAPQMVKRLNLGETRPRRPHTLTTKLLMVLVLWGGKAPHGAPKVQFNPHFTGRRVTYWNGKKKYFFWKKKFFGLPKGGREIFPTPKIGKKFWLFRGWSKCAFLNEISYLEWNTPEKRVPSSSLHNFFLVQKTFSSPEIGLERPFLGQKPQKTAKNGKNSPKITFQPIEKSEKLNEIRCSDMVSWRNWASSFQFRSQNEYRNW